MPTPFKMIAAALSKHLDTESKLSQRMEHLYKNGIDPESDDVFQDLYKQNHIDRDAYESIMNDKPTSYDPSTLGMSTSELRAALDSLENYTKDSHVARNTSLREGNNLSEQDFAMLRLAQPTPDMTLSRSFQNIHDEFGDAMNAQDFKAGDILGSKAFASTTNKIPTINRSDKGLRALIEARNEPLSIDVNKHLPDGMHNPENEVIFSPGQNYRLLSDPQHGSLHLETTNDKGIPKGYIASLAAAAGLGATMMPEDSEAAQLKKAMEALYLHGAPGSLLNEVGGMEVLKNPKYRDLLKLAKESDMSDDIGSKAVRVLKDPEGNTYAWPSAYLDHQSIADEVAPGYNFYANGDSDNFVLDKGKLKSYNLGEDHGHDAIPMDLNSERIKKFLPTLALGTAGTLAMPEDSNASTAELLAKLHELHPERMARAKAAGFDTDNIYMHGTNAAFDEFKIPKVGETSFGSNPAEMDPWIYTTNNPEQASDYASVVADIRGSDGANVIPVFAKNDKKIVHAADGETYDYVYPQHMKDAQHDNFLFKNVDDSANQDGMSWAQDVYATRDPRSLKSIFNDFTPESLASSKFALPAAAASSAYALSPEDSNAATVNTIPDHLRDNYFEALDAATKLHELDPVPNGTNLDKFMMGAYAPFRPIVEQPLDSAMAALSAFGLPETATFGALADLTYKKPLAYPDLEDLYNHD